MNNGRNVVAVVARKKEQGGNGEVRVHFTKDLTLLPGNLIGGNGTASDARQGNGRVGTAFTREDHVAHMWKKADSRAKKPNGDGKSNEAAAFAWARGCMTDSYNVPASPAMEPMPGQHASIRFKNAGVYAL